MTTRVSAALLAVLLGAILPACGADVSSTSAGGSSSAPTTCEGDVFPCVTHCGALDNAVSSSCVDGAWTCPSGTFPHDPNCSHPPPPPLCEPANPCEECFNDTPECVASPECLAECPSKACGFCPFPDAPVTLGDCTCVCSPEGEFICGHWGCCTSSADCATPGAVCVEGMCKDPPPTPGECWDDTPCDPSFEYCMGVWVCPCGMTCSKPDLPGHCGSLPPP